MTENLADIVGIALAAVAVLLLVRSDTGRNRNGNGNGNGKQGAGRTALIVLSAVAVAVFGGLLVYLPDDPSTQMTTATTVREPQVGPTIEPSGSVTGPTIEPSVQTTDDVVGPATTTPDVDDPDVIGPTVSTSTSTPGTTTSTTTSTPSTVPTTVTTVPDTTTTTAASPSLGPSEVPDDPGSVTDPPRGPPGAAVGTPKAGSSYEVQPGDNLWTISARVLEAATGSQPSDSDVLSYWTTLIDASSSELVDAGNPDLILPGQHFDLPALGAGSTGSTLSGTS